MRACSGLAARLVHSCGSRSAVIEFLGAVGVADVVPRATGHASSCLGRRLSARRRVVVCSGWFMQGTSDCPARPSHSGRPHNSMSVGYKIEQADRLCTANVGGTYSARRRDDQRHMRRTLPAGPLAPVLFLAKMPSMIAPQHHDGVVSIRTGFERCRAACRPARRQTRRRRGRIARQSSIGRVARRWREHRRFPRINAQPSRQD